MREIKEGLRPAIEAALRAALEAEGWCQSRAADRLEMPLSTLRWEIARCPELAAEMVIKGRGVGRPAKGSKCDT